MFLYDNNFNDDHQSAFNTGSILRYQKRICCSGTPPHTKNNHLVYDDSCLYYRVSNHGMRYKKNKRKQYVANRIFTIPYQNENNELTYYVIKKGEKYTEMMEKDGNVTLSRNSGYRYIEIPKRTLMNCFNEVREENNE